MREGYRCHCVTVDPRMGWSLFYQVPNKIDDTHRINKTDSNSKWGEFWTETPIRPVFHMIYWKFNSWYFDRYSPGTNLKQSSKEKKNYRSEMGILRGENREVSSFKVKKGKMFTMFSHYIALKRTRSLTYMTN